MPGGSGSGIPGGGEGEGNEQSDDEGWGREASTPSGDGGWSTSNEIPEVADIPPPPDNGGGSDQDGEGGGASGSKTDEDLDKALGDLDGDILSERSAIKDRAAAAGNPTTLPGEGVGSGSSDTSGGQAGGSAADAASSPLPDAPPPSAPPMPSGRAGAMPDDLPDARDDDIIARQLREAAMAETDPDLKEKLWEEYRRYKNK